MGDVLDLDVEGRRVQEIEPAPAQHALPGARPRDWRALGMVILSCSQSMGAFLGSISDCCAADQENMDEIAA